MAVGLSAPEELQPVSGVSLNTVAGGLRYTGRDDLVLLQLGEGTRTAAVFTQNRYCAAPVQIAKQHLADTPPRAFLINAGNANAGTGKTGLQNAQKSCELLAAELGLQSNEVLPFSTGVIGEQLPMAEFEHAIRSVSKGGSDDHWLAAAHAIMTTDTVAKGVSEQCELNGQTVTITGIAKGAGMICPNMATMLGFIATDARISQTVLQEMLITATEASFNRITVDGDTSTNDALMLSATGASEADKITSMTEQTAQTFYAALERVCVALATSIIRDGEGANRFVTITVSGAGSQDDARSIAYSVAHSPLVKTALYAGDPNWGRILAAIGNAPVSDLDIERVDMQINRVPVISAGEPDPSYSEALGQQLFAAEEVEIDIQLNLGEHSYHVWTSDLSHDYVSINADYRS